MKTEKNKEEMERLRQETLKNLQGRFNSKSENQSISTTERNKNETKSFDPPPHYEDPPSYQEARKIKKYYG